MEPRFFRALAAVSVLAFVGLYVQAPALVGRAGLDPAHAVLERRRAADALESFAGLPTCAWILEAVGLDGAAAADALALAGAALALLLAAGPPAASCAPAFAALALLWVSLLNLLPPHLEQPGDGLLAEALWAASLAAPLLPLDAARPLDGPAFLVRWVLAKAAFLEGRAALPPARAAWAAGGGLAPALSAVVGVVAAPLALVPSPGAAAAAGLALAVRALASRAGWPSALQAILCVPLVFSGGATSARARRRDDGGGGGLAAATATAAAAAYTLPALAAAAQLLVPGSAATDDAAVESALARCAPWAVACAAASLAALAARDLWRAVGPPGGAGEGAGEGQRGPAGGRAGGRGPAPLSSSRALSPTPPPPRTGRGGPPPALPAPAGHAAPWATFVAGAAALILAAGSAEIVARPGGERGCSACAGGRAGWRLAARRAHYALRPWRAAGGGSSGGLGRSSGGGGGGGVLIEGASACGEGDGAEPAGWARLAPPPAAPAGSAWWWADPPRLAAGLATRAPAVSVGGPGGEGAAPPPWVDHLAHRLVNGRLDGRGDDDPVWAAATGAAGGGARPCAVRVLSTATSPPLTLLPPTRPADADQALRLASAGRGPLVEGQYAPLNAAQRAVGGALAAPRAGGWVTVVVLGVAAAAAAARAALVHRHTAAPAHKKRE